MDIQPEKHNIDQVFSNTVYHIDFYQRDYKWTEEPVKRLLDDIFFQFEETYKQNHSLEPSKENIYARYPWYYLNTYVTNTVQGRTFIVDGQQRLTTLTLILLKLLELTKSIGSKNGKWIERKIAGYSGPEQEFLMNHVRHIKVLKDLMEGIDPVAVNVESGVTAVNMVRNYQLISKEIEPRLKDLHKFDSFVFYFLNRLVLINLSVDSHHVPMVFEVINDRGVRLKPYEILKGKLLGQIDKVELEHGGYNGIWDEQVGKVNAYRDDEIDTFFRYWLKAKFADTRKEGQQYDGEYHREMFKSEINGTLHLDHNPIEVKAFLRGPFKYYTKLYTVLWRAAQTETPGMPSVHYNSLNELHSQFMLIMSACSVNDIEETEKIEAVASGLDRMFTLLQLQNAYNSNDFALRLIDLNVEIREKSAKEIGKIFERHLIEEIGDRRGVPTKDAFTYQPFRLTSVQSLNPRFTRYLFARVEQALADGTNQRMKHSVKELVTLRATKNGFHLEHILSRNQENIAAFDGDEERFELERNRLGGVLLMKGKDNISSNDEVFVKKLESYAGTLLWNETLRADAYKSKLDFREYTRGHSLAFKPYSQFGPNELEERHRLLFDLCAHIWSSASDGGQASV